MPTDVYYSRADRHPHAKFFVRAGETYAEEWLVEVGDGGDPEVFTEADYVTGYTANGYYLEIAATQGAAPAWVLDTVTIPDTTNSKGTFRIVIPSTTSQEMFDQYAPVMYLSVWARFSTLPEDTDGRDLVWTGTAGLLPA